MRCCRRGGLNGGPPFQTEVVTNRTAEQPETIRQEISPSHALYALPSSSPMSSSDPRIRSHLAQCSPSAAGQLDKPELLLVGDTAPRSVGELRKGDPDHGFPTYPPRFVFSRPSGMEEMVL